LISVTGSLTSAAGPAFAGKHHVLKAVPDDVAWGWLDPREKPRLTIDSGDTVSIETLMHARDQIHKDFPMDEIVALRKANPGGGPHSLTGPIRHPG
jgi:acetamidase/formamidase